MRFKALGLVLAVGALALAMAQGKPDHTGHAEHANAPATSEAADQADLNADDQDVAELGEGGDSATVPALPQSRADSVVLIRHQFNHREQIIAGGVVMACIAAMMAIMNNYNPR